MGRGRVIIILVTVIIGITARPAGVHRQSVGPRASRAEEVPDPGTLLGWMLTGTPVTRDCLNIHRRWSAAGWGHLLVLILIIASATTHECGRQTPSKLF